MLAGVILVVVCRDGGRVFGAGSDVDVAGHFEGCSAGCVFAVEEGGVEGEEVGCYCAHALFDCLFSVSLLIF